MTPAAKSLVRAILTRLRDIDSTASKTKLLKLLYLADIEHFRKTEATLTGFDWIFYLYGPWAADFDKVLEQLQTEGLIDVRGWTDASLEGQEIRITDPLDIEKIISDTDEYFRTKRMIDTFAALSTPELLDYVYFSTEPMEGAEKLQPLDFSKVSREGPRLYRRSISGTPRQKAEGMKARFRSVREEIEKASQEAIARFWTPTIDEHYIKALEVLNREGEE
jgi:uncharacterized protein YwgA